ncbi:MAG: NERD domain-containing protein [Gammaproteobacteria bacterium]|nr:NERD domain-containing protein [Gammaproteobacteria bacterium]
MEFLNTQAGLYSMVALGVIFFGATGWYFWRQLQKTRHQRQIHKVLESLGTKYLHDIILPDGIEGYTYIDYLLLTPKGMIVLDINFSEGHLFGGESVDQWTQVVNNKTYKFDNPLYNNLTKCQAVQWNINNNISEDARVNNNVETFGWIAFSSAGNFPKGIPNHVSMIGDLKNDLEEKFNLSAGANESTRKIWNRLHDLSIATRKDVGQ